MATLKMIGFWGSVFVILTCAMYLSVPGAIEGSHVHFTRKDGEVLRIQHPDCNLPGSVCPDLHHDCVGEVVRIIVE